MKAKTHKTLKCSGDMIAGIILAIVFMAFVGHGYWLENNYEYRCVGESKVVKILELKYRDAIILLENGMEVEVSQARLKLGDTYCYDYKEFEIE